MFRAPGLLFFVLTGLGAQPYLISTVAGGAPPRTPAPATSISVGDPARVATDASGNVYFGGLHTVFKVDTSGMITRIAGTGRAGIAGDGGPALAAQVNQPVGIAIDTAGNVYFAERDANLIRKISVDGTISRFAGTGKVGYGGDGGPALNALLNGPTSLKFDSTGTLYFSDTNNHAIRKITPDGTILPVAGTGAAGFSHDGDAATVADLNSPEGIAFDSKGNLYLADTFNNRVRMIGIDGKIQTVAGNGRPGFFGDGGPALDATLFFPTDVAIDRNGALIIADLGNNRIRQVSDGNISTIAGTSKGSMVEGEPAIAVRLNGPSGVAVDFQGNIYFTQGSIGSGSGLQSGDHLVWRIASNGIVDIAAGDTLNSFAGDFAAAPLALLDQPTGMAVDSAGNLYFADTKNNRIRKIAANGTITTVVGNGLAGFEGDGGQATVALLNAPQGVAVDVEGNLYIADTGNNRVRKVFPDGIIGTMVGNGNAAFFGDGGSALNASLNAPRGVAIGPGGLLYVADTGNHRIRRVDGDGILDTVAGRGLGATGDGGPATNALLRFPSTLAFDSTGAYYIADQGNRRLRKVGTDGTIHTFGSEPIDAAGVAVDGAGNVYASDLQGNRVLRIAPDETTQVIAGTGACCYSGDGGPATAAQLNHPWGVAADAAGGIAISDSANNAIRYLYQGSALSFVRLVANGASNLAGPVAPGEIVVIFGTGLGPSQLVLGQNSSAVVRFGGIVAPLLYASATQVSAIVPYGVKGPTATLTVDYAGQTATSSVAVAQSAPALFTADSSGAGQAKALNPDGSTNSVARPAAPGSVITLFATGEGQTSPAGIDGKLADDPAPRPLLDVQAFVAGRGATVRSAGGIPGVVAGLMRVEVEIPAGTPGGSVPVAISMGGVMSPTVTIAVSGN